MQINTGILNDGDDTSSKSFTGREFSEMSEAKKADVLARMISTGTGGVFSRTEPKDKQVQAVFPFLCLNIFHITP